MLSAIFTEHDPQILERDIVWGDAQKKYIDKYMIVINSHIIDGYIRGDIIAILTPKEYSKLQFPEPFLPKYEVWEGLNLIGGDLGVIGFYM